MNRIAEVSVRIQSSSALAPSTPPWFGEVAVIAHYLAYLGVLAAIAERVRFARRRFGHYDLIDFVVVLLGYAVSSERTLEAFYERVQPFAAPSWPSSGESAFPTARHSLAFSPRSIKRRSRRCAPCFSKTCSLDH